MDKIQPGTPDGTEENVEKIAALFPEVITEVADEEGTLRHVVDYDALHELLGEGAEGQRERYQFTWPGKAAAKAEARKPIWKTMRPEPAKSVNWDTTNNLYIEGDNLDALKLLKETYAGKVKLIYIDPPYNTGHDFVYDDDFAQTHEEYDAESGDYDEDGGRLVANPESNGRFHSDWCSMIYPRLVLARDLLSADGAIFISIDDGEQAGLELICNEVFGRSNFVANIAWQNLDTVKNDAKYFSSNHEYILCYAKSLESLQIQGVKKGQKQLDYYRNPDNDPRGPYLLTPLHAKSGSASGIYTYTFSNGQTWTPPDGTYPRFSQETLRKLDEEGRLQLDPHRIKTPQKKTYLSDVGDRMPPTTFWDYQGYGSTRRSNKELSELLGKGVFPNPKPVQLIETLIDLLAGNNEALVLDFFSGSATTAEAVMRKNAEDGGTRRSILVQLPEEASGEWDTICDIGEERIRRAGAKIKAEVEEANRQLKLGEDPKPAPDIGFRVLRIDSSNMLDTYRTPGDTDQMDLLSLADNVKLNRSAEDLLFEVLPKFRIPYSAKIERRELGGRECFLVDGNRLVACFDTGVGTETIEQMARLEPDYAVMRDASMKDDATQVNFEELFKTYSPDTVRRVI